ncbi:MAG: cytochrome P450, partial [Chloroflexota bacterium]
DMQAAHAAGETVDLYAELQQVTMRVIGKVLFSLDVADIPNTFPEITRHALRFAMFQNLSPIKMPLWLPIPIHIRHRNLMAQLNTFMDELIDARLADPSAYDDILAKLIINYGEEAPTYREEIRHQLITLFFAGFETTNTALAWTWYLIAQHPEVEAKLLAEVESTLGQRPMTYDDMRALPYTGQVIAESLRLYPPVYTMPRTATEQDELGGEAVHPGDNVLLSLHTLHRMSEYWDDPDAFRPERFAPENLTSEQRDAYMPFGAGRRKCIGVNFATVEMMAVTCMMVRRYKYNLSPAHPVVPDAAVTVFPKYGIHMTLEARDNA